MIHDNYQYNSNGLESPGTNHFSISPDDNNDLAEMPRAIYVGGSGDLTIVDKSGVIVTYAGISGILPFRAVRVMSTGTTATGLVGIY